jgi:O-antigen/teichoic acid export membrane protein
MGELLVFGLSLLKVSTMNTIAQALDRTIIAAVSGVEAVAAFSVARQLSGYLKDFFDSLLGAMQSAIMRLVARGDDGTGFGHTTLALRLALPVSLAAVPPLVLFIDDFFVLWLGDTLPGAAMLALILGLCPMVGAAGAVFTDVLIATGRQQTWARHSIASILLSIALGAGAVYWLGPVAFAASALGAVLVLQFLLLPRVAAAPEGADSASRCQGLILRALLATALATLVACWLVPANEVRTWTALLLWSAVTGGASLLLLLVSVFDRAAFMHLRAALAPGRQKGAGGRPPPP